jgi:hypothetical protein
MVCIGDIFAIQFIMQSGMVCIGDAFNFFFFFFGSSWQVVIRGDRQVATFCYISENEQKQNLRNTRYL